MKPSHAISALVVTALVLTALVGEAAGGDPEFSTDVAQLFAKHAYECKFREVYSEYNFWSEPLLTAVNLISPVCAKDYYEYEFALSIVVFCLTIITALSVSDPLARCLYVLAFLVIGDMYTETHLFRQVVASYLMALWLLRRRKGGFLLPMLAFSIHNATTLLLYLMFDFRRIAKFIRNHLVIAFVVGIIGAYFFVHFLGDISSYVVTRYAFAFFHRGLTVDNSFAVDLYKYFWAALALGIGHAYISRNLSLFLLGLFGVLVLGVGSILNIDAEILFRLLVPFRFVLMPIFLATFFADLLRVLVARPPREAFEEASAADGGEQ